MSNYPSVARKHQALVDFAAHSLLQQRIDLHAVQRRCDHFITPDRACVRACRCMSSRPIWRFMKSAPQPHWQASQSGLSIEQNLTSLAGSDAAEAALPCDMDTALSAPGATVDFSVYVALVVRR